MGISLLELHFHPCYWPPVSPWASRFSCLTISLLDAQQTSLLGWQGLQDTCCLSPPVCTALNTVCLLSLQCQVCKDMLQVKWKESGCPRNNKRWWFNPGGWINGCWFFSFPRCDYLLLQIPTGLVKRSASKIPQWITLSWTRSGDYS